ncbi:MAG: metallophosphoesterase [Proteobacteria bacterium]|nr:metallophosphoesterase [Pseudomonadota bacterium]
MPRWTIWILFVLFSATVQILAHYYVWRRLVRDTGMEHPWRRRFTIAIVILALSIPSTLWASRLLSADIGRIMGWPVLLWLGFAALLLIGFLLIDGARIVLWSVRRGLARTKKGVPASFNPDRRQFLARVAGGTVVTAATGATAVGMHEVLKEHEIKEVPVTLSRLPPALDGFTIAQITDVHVGYTVTRSFVQSVVDRVNGLSPDLIAITGDLVDGDVDSLRDAVQPLAELSARHGVYFVTGNHEYYAGVEPWLDELERLGIEILRNQRVEIGRGRDGFDLAGVYDYQSDRFGHGADLNRALGDRDPDREVVLLAHQPRHVYEAARYGVGLQLSGHTHGGQIWPWHYVVKAQQRGLLAGLSRHGETQLYISRGTGYWGPPIRVGAPAEITRVVLRSGSAA